MSENFAVEQFIAFFHPPQTKLRKRLQPGNGTIRVFQVVSLCLEKIIAKNSGRFRFPFIDSLVNFPACGDHAREKVL